MWTSTDFLAFCVHWPVHHHILWVILGTGTNNDWMILCRDMLYGRCIQFLTCCFFAIVSRYGSKFPVIFVSIEVRCERNLLHMMFRRSVEVLPPLVAGHFTWDDLSIQHPLTTNACRPRRKPFLNSDPNVTVAFWRSHVSIVCWGCEGRDWGHLWYFQHWAEIDLSGRSLGRRTTSTKLSLRCGCHGGWCVPWIQISGRFSPTYTKYKSGNQSKTICFQLIIYIL